MKLFDLVEGSHFVDTDEIAADEELSTDIQDRLIFNRLLDGPSDGKFGRMSQQGLKLFQDITGIVEGGVGVETGKRLLSDEKAITIDLSNNDLAAYIVRWMLNHLHAVSVGRQRYNIVYVEGMNLDGQLNSDADNRWNDLRIVIEVPPDGHPVMVDRWVATSEPGLYYVRNPLNPNGCARIAFGQYKAWQVGVHGNSEPHEALVQTQDVKVFRDLNKDGSRAGDKTFVGLFGINQHWGYDMKGPVDRASAGCLVGQSRFGHKQFMGIIKNDRRYILNHNYTFITTIIPGDELDKLRQ